MLKIRSSENELDIGGTDEDFILLRREIESFLLSGGKDFIDFECDEKFEPEPYLRTHSSMRIMIGAGPNHFDHSRKSLQVLGSFQALRNFVDNFPDGDGGYPGTIQYHHHYDNISFPEYVSPESPSVTLSLKSNTFP